MRSHIGLRLNHCDRRRHILERLHRERAAGIALLIVGYDEFTSFGGGFLLWIALVAACVGAGVLVWRDATTYS